MSIHPGGRVAERLEQERCTLARVPAERLEEYLESGSLVIDIRPASDREREGDIPGAIVVERNVLEWRLDPTSPDRLAGDFDESAHVIIVCNEGYASSLAAVSLCRLGLRHATDLAGGYRAWRRLKDSSVEACPENTGALLA